MPATSSDRRTFLKTAGAVAATGAVAPTILNASDKAGSKPAVVGEGDHAFECWHNWGELPDHIVWGETHGVAIDADEFIYIKHRSDAPEPMDAIAVFDPEGKFVRSFGKEYHGGGHGIDVRKEDGEEFLYLCDMKRNEVIKTNLAGEQVWKKGVPTESGKYPEGQGYKPTNVAFSPDGGFYIGDGYGSHYIHQYDADANYVHTWGGQGDEPGKMRTPHGLWLDDRPGRDPTLIVADRANARLQRFTLDGDFIEIHDEVSFPAHFDIRGEHLLVPDLHARVTILDGENKVVAHLGYDENWTKAVLDGFKMRREPERWEEGRFIHPHDACYDANGDVFVVEWVATGRVTKLVRV